MGGVIERAEPDRVTRDAIEGRLRAGVNFVHGGSGRGAIRGGSRAALTLTEQSISDLTGVFRWSPTGALLVAHSAANDKHYAYALQPDGSLALPVGAATESGSRADLDWDVTAPIWPQACELFETLFVCDTKLTGREALTALKLSGGVLTPSVVQADLDGDTTAAPLKPSGVFSYGSVLFAYGWEDETVGEAPHILRHSLLGQDPADAAAWDVDAYATIGAQGEPIRAACVGQDIALVAKYGELFRVFGDPEANPGWQFQIQPVNASMRLGAVNQHALAYESDRWWGIGRDGPYAFDGRAGSALVGSRRERWGQVGDLANAFVAPHPARGCVLFGFPEPAALVSGARASRFWVFDTQADVWAPDFLFPSRFYMTAAVAESGVVLDDIPDSLLWLEDPAAIEFDAFTMDFLPGDVTALTEVWVEPAGGSFALSATLPAGVRGFRVSGVARGTTARVKIRHRKGDALTEFGTTVEAQTLIDPPRILDCPTVSSVRVAIPRADMTVEWATLDSVAGNNASGSVPSLPAGTYDIDLTADGQSDSFGGPPHLSIDLALGVGARLSPTLRMRNAVWTGLSPIQNADTVAVSQQMDAIAESSIDVLVTARPSLDHFESFSAVAIQYRVFGDTSWITFGTYAYAKVRSVVVTGLAASTRYEVRGQFLYSSAVQRSSDPVIMFTRIALPTATIATAGAGTPVTNITVTPPGALPGFDTEIRNAGGAFDALYSNVSTAPTAYQSTVGSCGTEDRYFVRARSTSWPDGYQYSAPVELSVVNPCVIAP